MLFETIIDKKASFSILSSKIGNRTLATHETLDFEWLLMAEGPNTLVCEVERKSNEQS